MRKGERKKGERWKEIIKNKWIVKEWEKGRKNKNKQTKAEGVTSLSVLRGMRMLCSSKLWCGNTLRGSTFRVASLRRAEYCGHS
jgi:hypothetical protein